MRVHVQRTHRKSVNVRWLNAELCFRGYQHKLSENASGAHRAHSSGTIPVGPLQRVPNPIALKPRILDPKPENMKLFGKGKGGCSAPLPLFSLFALPAPGGTKVKLILFSASTSSV